MLIALPLLAIASGFLVAELSIELLVLLALCAGTILVSSVSLVSGGTIRGTGRVIKGALAEEVVRPLALIVGIAVVVLLSREGGLTTVSIIAAYFSASMVACLFNLRFLFGLRLLSPPKESERPETEVQNLQSKWVKSLLPLSIYSGIQSLYGHLDIVIIGSLLEQKDVGIYKAMVQLSSVVVIGLAAINQMLSPWIAKSFDGRDMEQLQKSAGTASLIIILISIVPALVIFVFAEELVSVIFGMDYGSGVPILKLLVITHVVNVAFGSVGMLLNMTGHEREAMVGVIVSILLNVALSVLLIPIFGLIAAAVSSLVATFLWNYILRVLVKRRIGIESSGLIFLAQRLMGRSERT
jgi:O-antigen/teichoic acid export membrane protein